jgi:hypothetical protein
LTTWADHKPILSDIRLAVKTGQRPTAMILRDKYAGYREYLSSTWVYEEAHLANTREYTDWDMTLASVAQIIEDYTNKQNGQIYFFDESDRVQWEVRSSFSGYDAALENDDKTLEPGESRYAIPIIDEDNPPTIWEWLDSLEDHTNHPPGYKNNGLQDWEILDAKEEAGKRRDEIKAKLLRGEAL